VDNGANSTYNSGGQGVQISGIIGEFDIAGQDFTCSTIGGSAIDSGVLDDSIGDSLKSSIDESFIGFGIQKEGSDGSGGEGLTVVVNVGKGEGLSGSTRSDINSGDDN
jgi:hypothetical protein